MNFIHFIFSLICSLNKFNFLFLWSLVNDTYSNLKLVVFITTSFVCSKKELKQIVLINHSYISLTLERGRGWSSVYSPKSGRGWGKFFTKKCRSWWNSRGRLLRESNLWFSLNFVFVNPRNVRIQGIYKNSKF